MVSNVINGLWLVDSKLLKLLRDILLSIDLHICLTQGTSRNFLLRFFGVAGTNEVFFVGFRLWHGLVSIARSEDWWVLFLHLSCILVEYVMVLLARDRSLMQEIKITRVFERDRKSLSAVATQKVLSSTNKPRQWVLALRVDNGVSPFEQLFPMPIHLGQLGELSPWSRLTI